MSTIPRTHRIRLTIGVAALAFALVGGIASAFAQSAGGNGRGGGGSSSGGAPDPSAIVTYGTPGNCPPTMACGADLQRRPHIVRVKPHDGCGEFPRTSRAYRQCRSEL